MSKLPQPWLSYRRQCQQTLHPTSAHSDCEQSLQPIDLQGQPAACLPGGSGPKDVYTSGGFMGHVVHLPPIPQHPRTPGHKAFRSQLTANELGGIRFAGVGPKLSTVQPRSARANLLWQPRALGIWGRYLPTPIGDAGCPWEWPPTDVTPRDITLEGLPPPSPYTDRASAPTTMWRGGIVDWTPLLVQLDHRSMCPSRCCTRNRRSCADRWSWSSKGSWPGTRGPPTVSNRGPFSTYGTSMRSATSQRSNSWNPVLT